MGTKSFDLIHVNVDELQLSMLGFDIIDAQARLVYEWDEYESVFEYELHWSVRGRFDPEEWRDRFSTDWSPQLVPMVQVPELGNLPIAIYWSPLDRGKRSVKVSERRDLLKSKRRIDASAVVATITAFDSAQVDYDMVPLTRGATHVPVDVLVEDTRCGCKPQFLENHASVITDEDGEQSLQLYMLGSVEMCNLEGAGPGARKGGHSDDHELPRLTLDLLDETGFMLEEKAYLVDLRAQLGGSGMAMRQPRWIYTEKIDFDRLTSAPGRVVATFSGDMDADGAIEW